MVCDALARCFTPPTFNVDELREAGTIFLAAYSPSFTSAPINSKDIDTAAFWTWRRAR